MNQTPTPTFFRDIRVRHYAPNLCSRSGFDKYTANHSTCPVTGSISMATHISYANWAAHHAECATCAEEHWYHPDVDRLCKSGRFLFGSWYGSSAKSEAK